MAFRQGGLKSFRPNPPLASPCLFAQAGDKGKTPGVGQRRAFRHQARHRPGKARGHARGAAVLQNLSVVIADMVRTKVPIVQGADISGEDIAHGDTPLTDQDPVAATNPGQGLEPLAGMEATHPM